MEPPLELLIGCDERGFRIDLKMAAQIDHGKQQVTIFLFDIRALLRRHSFLQLCGFLGDLVEDRCCLRPVEADFRGFLLEFQSTKQGREGVWNIVQKPLFSAVSSPSFSRRSARSAFPQP